MQQDHGTRFLKGIINPKEPGYWLVAAVLATFISSALYDAFMVGIWEWLGYLNGHWGYIIVRLLLALGLGFLFLILLPKALALAERRQEPATVKITQHQQVKRPRVLITYVSAPRDDAPKKTLKDSHAEVVRYFLNQPHDGSEPIITLLLVHSGESQQHAEAYANDINQEPVLRIEAICTGLLADFHNLESVYTTTRTAINMGLGLGRKEDVLLDLTGGTKLSSSGGFLAGMHTGVSLSYYRWPNQLEVLAIPKYDANPPILTTDSSGDDTNDA